MDQSFYNNRVSGWSLLFGFDIDIPVFNANSKYPDRTAFCGISSGPSLFALNTGISIKHGNNKNQPDTPYIGSGPVQRVKG